MNEFVERRDGIRFTCRVPLSIQHTNFGMVHGAKALNWGEGGVAFETDHELRIGTIVFIKKGGGSDPGKLYSDCRFSRLSSFATVKWVCCNGANRTPGFVVGAENFAYGSFY
jgi:hypothetical protein